MARFSARPCSCSPRAICRTRWARFRASPPTRACRCCRRCFILTAGCYGSASPSCLRSISLRRASSGRSRAAKRRRIEGWARAQNGRSCGRFARAIPGARGGGQKEAGMKVGIVGSGVVAQTLGAGFLKHGHQVALGTRDPAKLKDWSATHKGAAVKSFAETAAFGDVVVLAVAGGVALEAAKQAGGLAGKTVIDATNPIGGGPPVNG